MTTRSDCCFHCKFIPEPSCFYHISSGGPDVPEHFECGGGKFRTEGHAALPPLPLDWDILVPNEMGVADSRDKTGWGRGWQRKIQRPPQTRIPALMP